ncbi:hypothetical protein BCY89_07460 [Sphingobacterium siyangense]|uniref:Uncharacterized protein n=1 Tax=Sphingobacterium siyangense TaxID=459529 RepID=A0A420FPI4_9SPHI|nr:hypothetical protein BV902_11840 [Sphingobacterium sp. B29]MBB1642883.1 hypothetical protein [Sphingobacterium sp. UME9]RKF34792.1 hypothetical protein BCY89_07460 [Sphingobacterium siyangense]
MVFHFYRGDQVFSNKIVVLLFELKYQIFERNQKTIFLILLQLCSVPLKGCYSMDCAVKA